MRITNPVNGWLQVVACSPFPDAAGEMEDEIDRVLPEEFMSRSLIAQVKVLGRRRKDARIAVAAQTLNERLADHPAPTSDEYPRRFFHVDPGL